MMTEFSFLSVLSL